MRKFIPTLLIAVICLGALRAASAENWPNPLIEQRADPQIVREGEWYYFMGTVPDYDRLELRRAKTIAGLATAEPKTIWREHESGAMGSHIWAPEIHRVNGKWFVYFSAGAAEKDTAWDIRLYAIENDGENPLEGAWIERGQIKTGWESFTLDATTFVNRGVRYLCWAQYDPAIGKGTNIYLAKMSSPVAIEGQPVMISRPELPWELVRYRVNEAPAALVKNGRVFVTFSASGTGAEYCVGLVTARDDADLLEAKSWVKTPQPVFKTSEANGVFGPGHNSFTVAEDGVTDLLVFHARDYAEIKGDPLHDPNRHARVQVLRWKADGTPEFGVPEKRRK